MTQETRIADLERDWLAAETAADELKHEVERIDAEIRQCGGDVTGGETEVKVLLNQVKDIQARRQQAEQAALEAFDRLWSARDSSAGQHQQAANG